MIQLPVQTKEHNTEFISISKKVYATGAQFMLNLIAKSSVLLTICKHRDVAEECTSFLSCVILRVRTEPQQYINAKGMTNKTNVHLWLVILFTFYITKSYGKILEMHAPPSANLLKYLIPSENVGKEE